MTSGEEVNGVNTVMLRSENMILRRTGEVGQWLSDATAIYNQALYYLR